MRRILHIYLKITNKSHLFEDVHSKFNEKLCKIFEIHKNINRL